MKRTTEAMTILPMKKRLPRICLFSVASQKFEDAPDLKSLDVIFPISFKRNVRVNHVKNKLEKAVGSMDKPGDCFQPK